MSKTQFTPISTYASPAVGSIVSYILDQGTCRGETRPAIVLRIEEPPEPVAQAHEETPVESLPATKSIGGTSLKGEKASTPEVTPSSPLEPEASPEPIPNDTICDLLVFTRGTEDFDEASHPGASGTWVRLGIHYDVTGTMANWWH